VGARATRAARRWTPRSSSSRSVRRSAPRPRAPRAALRPERLAPPRRSGGASRERPAPRDPDGNEAFTPKTAARIAPRLAELGIGFFEEPCPRAGLAQLVAGSPVPIAYGEHVVGLAGFLELAEDRLGDVWKPDAVICGGMSELRRIAALAAALGARLCPHSSGTPIALAADLHAASGAPTLSMPEYSGRTDQLCPAFVGGAKVTSDAIEGGTLRPTDGPGIGIEPSPDVAERYRYRVPPPVTTDPALHQGAV